MDQKLKEQMQYCVDNNDKLSEEYFEQLKHNFKSIYLDLPYIQDIYLGAVYLLRASRSEEDYNYFVKCIPTYNKRPLLATARYFPEFNLTEEEIFSFISNSRNAKQLLLTSPMTNLFMEFRIINDKLHDLNRHLRSTEDYSYNPIKYIVNLYPLVLGDDATECIALLKDRMQYISEDMKLGVVNARADKLALDVYIESDILAVYDARYFFHPKSNATKPFCRQCKFINKIFYFPKFVCHKPTMKHIDEYDDKTLDKSLKLSENLLSMSTKLTLLQNPIVAIDED